MGVKDLSPDKKKLAKELARRRLFMIGYATALVATIFTITDEDDIFLHALDDYAIVALSIVVLIVILVWRKKESFSDMRMVNNLSLVIAIVLLVFVIFAFTQEINDASDFADDPAQLIFLILFIVNRFV